VARSQAAPYSAFRGGSGGASAATANGGGILPAGTESRYTYMDEEYLACLHAHMGWERDNGIIHLMPIAVVYQEDVY
jgi:hypothetical protein